MNFDPDRFPVYIDQALAYRGQLKGLYEEAAKKKGVTVKEFNQNACTWTPTSKDVDYLHSEGTFKHTQYFRHK